MLQLRQHALRPILELALLLFVKFTLGQHRRRWTAAAAVVVDEITVCLRPLDNFLFARIIVVVRRFVVDEFHMARTSLGACGATCDMIWAPHRAYVTEI